MVIDSAANSLHYLQGPDFHIEGGNDLAHEIKSRRDQNLNKASCSDADNLGRVDTSPVSIMTTFPELSTPRMRLVIPGPEFAEATIAFYVKNKDHLLQWEPRRDDKFYTIEYWREELLKARLNVTRDQAYLFYLISEKTGDLIGTINLNSITRAAFQNGRLGYKIDADHEGQGFMREGMAEVIRFAFEDKDLRRLEANVIPQNVRSLGLLKRLGFTEIGRDEYYLMINGIESPHILTSLVKRNWKK